MSEAMRFTARNLAADDRNVGKIMIQWLQHVKAGGSLVPPRGLGRAARAGGSRQGASGKIA